MHTPRLAMVLAALLIFVCAGSSVAQSLTQIASESLLANPRVSNPHRLGDPGTVNPSSNFTQGVPGDDFELTMLYVTPVITGELGGFDIFVGVNPQDATPGTGTVINAYGSVNPQSDDIPGDRFVLGDTRKTYFLGRSPGAATDSDFMRVLNTDQATRVQLRGTASEYTMVPVTTTYESGTAIFFDNAGVQDMIGFVSGTNTSNPNHPMFTYVTPADAPSPIAAASTHFGQLGGSGATAITDVMLGDAGSIFVVGMTREDLRPLYPDARGSGKLFAARYERSGVRTWLRQFGSAEGTLDLAFDADTDGSAVFVTGRYLGAGAIGQKDHVVWKLHATTGELEHEAVWGGPGTQFGGGIVIDNSEYVYAVGIGRDVQDAQQVDQDPFVEKRRRSDLSLVWRRTYGAGTNKEPWASPAFFPTGSSRAGQGVIYSAGWTFGDFFGPDTGTQRTRNVWLSCTDDLGNLLWVEQWGSEDDETEWPWCIDVDSNGFVYVVGHTYGDMNGASSQLGLGDGFITKFDPSRPAGQRRMWTRHVGTQHGDDIRRVRVVEDRLYISGYTWGAFPGFVNAGRTDVYAAQLDLNGELLTVRQWGSDRDERAFLDASTQRVAVAGMTEGSMTGPNAGFLDAFVLVTEPGLGLCDSIDFNNDGVSPDAADIADFLSVFSGSACSTGDCNDIDFDNNGVSPDTDDIDALLRVFSGEVC